MHYYIDGYNLMFRVLRAGDDLQQQRESIIRELHRKIHLLNLDVTLVFDAQYQAGTSTRTNFQHLKILFTEFGETADDLILQELKHEKFPQQHTVVTSDKKLAWLARRRHAKTETVEDFLTWLNSRYKNKIKRKSHPTPPRTLPRLIQPPQAPPPDSSQSLEHSSVEECYEYYLQHFETAYETMNSALPPKKTSSPSKKKKKNKIPPRDMDTKLSNEERWLKAFERDPNQDTL